MSIKISCLTCGFTMSLGDAYEEYRGEVRCWGCEAVMEIAMHEGKLEGMRLVKPETVTETQVTFVLDDGPRNGE